MKNAHRDRMLAAFTVILVTVGCVLPSLIQVEAPSYLERRDGFTTNLLEPGPSPQSWEDETPPPDVEEVFYESGDLKLKAWVYVPDGEQAEQHPALIYFHGGFAFGAVDMIDSQPFMVAGYVVMFPMLRGENGNPGNFELFFGEIDDAQAAAEWLAKQPYVDRNRIYAFGHSAGGGVSALLSLIENTPIRHSGSSGGLYFPGTFEAWDRQGLVPFDWKNEEEVELRLLFGNVQHMQRPHYAFIGVDDYFAEKEILFRPEVEDGDSLLSIVPLKGDHFTSLPLAVEKYLEIVEQSD